MLVACVVTAALAVKGRPMKWTEADTKRVSALADIAAPDAPQMIHIAFGNDPATETIFVYSVRNRPNGAIVRLQNAQTLASSFFNATCDPFDQPTQWICHVTATGLSPASLYTYSLGDPDGAMSPPNQFRTPAAGGAWGPRVAIYGDMGVQNERSSAALIRDAAALSVDAILHIGDFAYDMQESAGAGLPAGSRGDAFLNSMQNATARVQYQTCPGNHENADDFYQYRARFGRTSVAGSDTGEGAYSTFTLGPVRFVLFSTEVYFFPTSFGLEMLPHQHSWLDATLAAANADRAAHPWIVTAAHRPMYCSPNDDDDDCHRAIGWSLVRDGIAGFYGMEELLVKHGVDINFAAHEHAYARSWPTIKGVALATGPDAYTNPKGPVHILTGAGGNRELQDIWQPGMSANDAFHINVYGYGYLTVHNATHATWAFLDVDNGTIIDSITIVQNSHGPFTPL